MDGADNCFRAEQRTAAKAGPKPRGSWTTACLGAAALLRLLLRHHALPAMIGAPRAARVTREAKSWQAELVSVH
jgi:hypothetical protein